MRTWRKCPSHDQPSPSTPRKPNRDAPYDDGFTADGSVLLYRYRGENALHHDNIGLRRAMEERRPLIYFHGKHVCIKRRAAR